jgi:hypothetical protein
MSAVIEDEVWKTTINKWEMMRMEVYKEDQDFRITELFNKHLPELQSIEERVYKIFESKLEK